MSEDKSIVDKQKEQLARYEKRLRDVVTAYKGLSKEKEALEASLKILTEKSSKSGSEAQIAAEQKQLKTLSESLSVLSAEKSRMESNFQADKKKLRNEVEMLQNSLQDLAESEKVLKYENESLRSKLTSEKQDRLQEQESLHVMIRDLRSQHETRVASLEARLTELSVSVGDYDRHRNMDQQSIQLLKEQIMELESRASRTVAAEKVLEKQDSPEKKENEKIKNNDDVHASCREQYELLVGELEHVRQMQSINTILESRSQEANAEYEKLKSQNHNLQERINSLCRKLNQAENEVSLQKQNLKIAVDAEREKLQVETQALKRQHEASLADLEEQLRLLRERSLGILEEKDTEITKLRNALKNMSPTSVLASELSLNLDMDSETGAKSSDSPPLFHFSQENARNVVEATMLRKQNIKLESQLRELGRTYGASTLALEDKMEKLQQEIERLSLGQSREGANLEYLKNVVLRYLTCADDKNRRHMLTAICTVLRFSKAESRAVQLAAKK